MKFQWRSKIQLDHPIGPPCRWQYFGSTSGLLRVSPRVRIGRSESGLSADYDPRRQSWYTTASMMPVNAVIIVDISASMNGSRFVVGLVDLHRDMSNAVALYLYCSLKALRLCSAARRILLLQRRCVTDRAGVYSVVGSPSPQPRTLTCSRTAIPSPGLPFMVSTPVIHVVALIMEYYSFTDPKGMEGWVDLVGWPIAES